MQLVYNRSLSHCHWILERLRHELDIYPTRDGYDRVIVSCWSNGREQGFLLQPDVPTSLESFGDRPLLVFAEDRNSDAIVIIHGRFDDFDYTTHQPKGELWSSEESCRHLGDEAAIAFIRDWITAR